MRQMQPPLQNRQNEPSASSTQDSLSQSYAPTFVSSSACPASPAATSTATGATRPPLRASTSSPDPLAVPFEQLSLHDQDKLRRRQQQEKQIAQHSMHAPSNPYVGSEWESDARFVDESTVLRQHLGQNAKGKAPDHGHGESLLRHSVVWRIFQCRPCGAIALPRSAWQRCGRPTCELCKQRISGDGEAPAAQRNARDNCEGLGTGGRRGSGGSEGRRARDALWRVAG